MGRSGQAWALGLAAVTIVAACSGDGDTTPTVVVVTTTTEPPTPRTDDGTLHIGALVPSAEAAVGAAIATSLDDAVQAVNDAGGVLGNDVELTTEEEGLSTDDARQAIETLVDAGVDAIVGPTSSVTAIGALDAAVNAGIVSCSPTASAIALDGFPDDGLFFRTIASDSLQAVAIARQAERTGARRITIAHVDDAYGRPYARAVADEILTAEPVTVAVAVGAEDLTDDARDALTDEPRVLIVLGDGVFIAQFLAAVARSGAEVPNVIVVNDAARNSDARPLIADLPDDLRERIIGLAPQILAPVGADGDGGVDGDDDDSDGDDDPVPFAPQTRDCVNLLSLSAVQAQSDNPEFIAAQMSSVSSGGLPCTSFEDCESSLPQSQINYNGLTGIDLTRNGDPRTATFERFRFDDEGVDELDESGRLTVEFR